MEATRIHTIFKIYLNLKEFCKNNERKAFDNIYSQNKFHFYLTNSFINYLTSKIIYNDLYIKNIPLDCDSKIVTEHMTARKMMLEAKAEEIKPLNISKARKRYKNSRIRQLAYRKIHENCSVD